MKRFVFFVGAIIALSVFSLSVVVAQTAQKSAETPPKIFKAYMINGKAFVKDRVIRDFLKISFSSHMWFEDLPIDFDGGWTIRSLWPWPEIAPMDKKKLYPNSGITDKDSVYDSWILDLIPNAPPKFDAVHKWQGELTIGFGWPPLTVAPYEYDVDAAEIIAAKIDPRRMSDVSKSVTDKVSSSLAKISSLTKLPARLIYPENETADNYAKIRIILSDSFFEKPSDFKSDRSMSDNQGLPNGWAIRLNERDRMLTAVRFTPFTQYQVEGYFVPDENSGIRLAVCQINSKLSEKVILSLVTECLARVLGLPEASVLKENSILKPRSSMADTEMLTDFTAYDEAIISLLYCDKIKSGMGRYDVLKTLYYQDACFKDVLF